MGGKRWMVKRGGGKAGWSSAIPFAKPERKKKGTLRVP